MNPLAGARRLIVKIGSALLVEDRKGAIRRAWLDAMADDLASLRAEGVEVLVVSSGAIAIGRRHLGLPEGPLKLEEKQAAAATGQIRLAHAYQDALARHGLTVAQVLVTPDDTEQRRRHLNARGTLATLLRLGAVPVINENDTVATAEIRFGDNDRLAARVAQMISADMLVLLSEDIDGLYSADPRRDPSARHIAEVTEITAEIEAMAGSAPGVGSGGVGSGGVGSGGMVTKLAAARIATAAGCAMVIANGREANPIGRLIAGARHTTFRAAGKPVQRRKRWISGLLQIAGALVIDDGAVRALGRGKSLLPAGVTRVEGAFERGDPVRVLGPDGRVLGRGLAAYSSEDARRIAGKRSREIEAVLGYRGRDEIIHRDDLVVER